MNEHKTKLALAEPLVGNDPDRLKDLLRGALLEVQEGEMSEFSGAEPGGCMVQR